MRRLPVAEVGDLTDGGADHVIEAIGLTQTVELAIDLCGRASHRSASSWR